MRRRRDPSRALAASFVLLVSCSSTKEWEEKPGSVALFATPLPPVAGQPLTLGVTGTNVGPIDVFQGSVRIASFANVELERRVDVRVIARSDEPPRAVTMAYDYRVLEVAAAAFPSPPAPPDLDAGSEPDPGPAESCAGVEDLSANACPAADGRTIAVRVHNASPNPVSVYELTPGVIEPTQCLPALHAIVRPGNTGEFSRPAGAVLRIVDDRTAAAVRIVRLPDVDVCTLRVPRGT